MAFCGIINIILIIIIIFRIKGMVAVIKIIIIAIKIINIIIKIIVVLNIIMTWQSGRWTSPIESSRENLNCSSFIFNQLQTISILI